MSDWLLVVQLLLFAGMIGVSWWGATRVDPNSRFTARAGATGMDWTMSKSSALFVPPAVGFLILLGTFWLRDSDNKDTIAVIGALILIFVLLAHASTVRRAAR